MDRHTEVGLDGNDSSTVAAVVIRVLAFSTIGVCDVVQRTKQRISAYPLQHNI